MCRRGALASSARIDLIAAEDTRVTRKLLDRFDIPHAARLLHAHSTPGAGRDHWTALCGRGRGPRQRRSTPGSAIPAGVVREAVEGESRWSRSRAQRGHRVLFRRRPGDGAFSSSRAFTAPRRGAPGDGRDPLPFHTLVFYESRRAWRRTLGSLGTRLRAPPACWRGR